MITMYYKNHVSDRSLDAHYTSLIYISCSFEHVTFGVQTTASFSHGEVIIAVACCAGYQGGVISRCMVRWHMGRTGVAHLYRTADRCNVHGGHHEALGR